MKLKLSTTLCAISLAISTLFSQEAVTNHTRVTFNSRATFVVNATTTQPVAAQPLPNAHRAAIWSNHHGLATITLNPTALALRGSLEVRAQECQSITIGPPPGTAFSTFTAASFTNVNGYELTITAGDGLAARPDDPYANANTPDAPISIIYEPTLTNATLILRFTSGTSGKVSWSLTPTIITLPSS